MMNLIIWGVMLPILSTGFMALLHELYFKGGVCKSTKRLDGKTVIITGANTGIGLETAVDLASRGGRVIMACRSLDRGNAALLQVKNRANTNNVNLMQLDLSSLDSVEKFAEEFRQKESRLDILINNAGIMAVPKSTTKDGFESQIGVNHLGPFLLTNLLLDMLEESGPGSRVVSVSSLAHRRASFNVFDLMMEDKPYDKWEQYGNSKLANILFTRELSNQVKESGVTTYAVHPGVIMTELGRSLDSPVEKLFAFLAQYTPLRYALKTVPEGAQTTICCAVSEDLANESGQYYADCALSPLLVPQASDEALAKQLWKVSMTLTGLKESASQDDTVDG